MRPDLSFDTTFPIVFTKIQYFEDDIRHVGVVRINNKKYYSLVGIVPDKTQDDIGFDVETGEVLYVKVIRFGERYVYDYDAAKYVLLEVMGKWRRGSWQPHPQFIVDEITKIELEKDN